jgi:hypothetical protein
MKRTTEATFGCFLGVCALLVHSVAFADVATRCQRLLATSFAAPGDASSLVIDSTTVVAATADVPEYCQVIGHLDSEVNFVLKMPSTWNDKLMMEGNSGFAGEPLDYLASVLDWDVANNYAALATDTGHSGGPEQLLNRPDRIANLMYRSVHIVSLAAKEIVTAYYSAVPRHSYFEGCSRGGTQAMDEASRYPGDFDGLVAGAPNLPSGGFRLWNSRALFPSGPQAGGVITSDKVALLSSLVLKKCDSMDGRVDGIVSDPRACNFSPIRDLPRCQNNVDGPGCVTSVQAAIFEKIHQGPQSGGRSIGAPYYYSGVEGYNYGDAFGVGEDILDFAYNASGFPENPLLFPDFYDVGSPSFDYWLETQYLRYIVFSDPNFDLANFNYENRFQVSRYIQALAPQFPPGPNLSAFARKGGKLIIWQGEGDPVVNYEVTREFYEASARAAGGLKQAKSFERLFAVPGTTHCGGGPGPWAFDAVPALEQWVESSTTPKSIVGFAPDTNSTQPVCAYPKQARLIGKSADPTVAASYRCVDVDYDPRDDID